MHVIFILNSSLHCPEDGQEGCHPLLDGASEVGFVMLTAPAFTNNDPNSRPPSTSERMQVRPMNTSF